MVERTATSAKRLMRAALFVKPKIVLIRSRTATSATNPVRCTADGAKQSTTARESVSGWVGLGTKTLVSSRCKRCPAL